MKNHKEKYWKVYNELLNAIESGHLRAGDRLEPEISLCRTFGVGRNTIRHAIQLLSQDGYLYRNTKCGTFIVERGKSEQTGKKIAIILPYEESNNYRILDAVIESNAKYGYFVDVFYSKLNLKIEREILLQIMKEDYIGIIIWPASNTENLDVISRMILKKIQIVLIDMPIEGLKLPIVMSDNQKGFYELVSYYIEQGYKKIAFALPMLRMNHSAIERFMGYCNALLDHGIAINKSYILQGAISEYDFYRSNQMDQEKQQVLGSLSICKQYDSLKSKPNVICFVNDASAADFIRLCKKHKREINKEIVITGFDNLMMSDNLEFSTVRQNFYAIGKKALWLLHNKITGGNVKQVNLVCTKLIICK